MKKCVVSLVGDQTIPNILIAAHYNPDYLLFLTTRAMEKKGKSQAILNTLALRGQDYTGRCHTIIVTADSIVDLQNKVTEWINEVPEDFSFILNLTGGTKLMSIAAYDAFMDFGSEMVYLPIPKNEILIPFPKRRPRQPVALTERLSVQDYLTACGFNITNWSKLGKYKERCRSRKNVTLFLYQNYKNIQPLLKALGAQIRPLKKNALKRGCNLTMRFDIQNRQQAEFLEMLGFKQEGAEIHKLIGEEDWEYLRGGWLEERLLLAVDAALPGGKDVCMNLMCEDPSGNKNEFDVLFTFENVLYLIECKSLGAPEGGENDLAASINSFLYKLGALRQNFGLTPRAFWQLRPPMSWIATET